MRTFCKLKDGRKMVVFSDNDTEETMDVFPVEELEHFDAEYLTTINVSYNDIERTDTNMVIAYR